MGAGGERLALVHALLTLLLPHGSTLLSPHINTLYSPRCGFGLAVQTRTRSRAWPRSGGRRRVEENHPPIGPAVPRDQVICARLWVFPLKLSLVAKGCLVAAANIKKKPTETGQSSETQRNGLLNLPKVLCGFGIDIPRTSLAAVGHDCYQYLHHPPAGEKRLRKRTLEGPSACNGRQDTFAWLDGGT